MIVSRFNRFDTSRVNAGGSDVSLLSSGDAARGGPDPRHERTRGALSSRSMRRWLGDAPYPSFTLALAESDRPGGHSPPYFAVLNQVVPGSNFVWRNDPVSFENYPAFFLAHEVAHQWWGHAVGWKNYHEQWLSEGFAQYFAALYAEKERKAPSCQVCSGRCGARRSTRHRTARSISAIASVTSRATIGSFAPSSTTRARWCCTCFAASSATTPSSPASVRSTRSGNSRRPAPTTSASVMEKASGRDLQRFFDTWMFGFAIPARQVQLSGVRDGSDDPLRAAWRARRRSRHGDGDLRVGRQRKRSDAPRRQSRPSGRFRSRDPCAPSPPTPTTRRWSKST